MITFIETPTPWVVRKHAQISLGPLYLATILKHQGFAVRIFRPDTIEDISEVLDSDVVAFTGTTLEYPMVEKCARFVRENNPNISIWYGGIHATTMYKELSAELFDAVALGEAEHFVGIMASDQEQNRLKPIYVSANYVPIINLDTIPIPDRSLIEGPHGGGIFAFDEDFKGAGNENVIVARGCPFDCHFCASKSIFPCVRFRSVDNVIAEIESIVKLYGTKQFRFADDNLTTSKKRLLELCRKLEPYDLAYRASARVHTLDKEMAEALYKSGCKEISVGVESGDQTVLDFLNKNSDLKRVAKGVQIAAAAGIHIRAMLMIGTPGERSVTPELTIQFIEDTAFHSITLSNFIPLPGSQIFNHPARYDCEILTKDFEKYDRNFWVWNQEQDAKQVTTLGKEFLIIRNLRLSEAEQIDNVNRMSQYVEKSKLNNKG
jgi:anaerobic magnesium-protoporphyrin IX monomethyl ester cyclase